MWDASDIQARLAVMSAEDPQLRRFGATRHRYRLGPILSEADVAAFEAHHRITLPDAYRSFLLTVGDGGAGPDHGLYPLSGDGLREDDGNERWQSGHLATPFPHTQRWSPWESRDPNAVSNDEYLASFDARWVTGSLVIAEFGSGAFHRLVVTGPARGQVWFDDRAADGGLAPEADFPAWYQNWLHNPK